MTAAAAAHPHHAPGMASNGALFRGQSQVELAAQSPDLRKMTPSSTGPVVGLPTGGHYSPFSGHYPPQGSSDLLSRNADSVGQLKDPYLSLQSLQRNMNPMANFRTHPTMNAQAAMSPHAHAMGLASPQQSFDRLQQQHLQHRQTPHTHPTTQTSAAASPMLTTAQPQHAFQQSAYQQTQQASPYQHAQQQSPYQQAQASPYQAQQAQYPQAQYQQPQHQASPYQTQAQQSPYQQHAHQTPAAASPANIPATTV
ncbi:Fungal specific transcription factor domain family protein [Aspergillus niger]|uniref:Fungal specific transcription factor domain family protein n=1 Tax=Aspergillus niger TaxID=5061 RepID=A0A505I2P9_ASPNG|nr:Fungal specific transcription factor domain family protein [Aspergillus niger]